MNISHNLYDLLDLVDGFVAKFKRTEDSSNPEMATNGSKGNSNPELKSSRASVRMRSKNEAWNRYDNIVGRFDVPKTAESRNLVNVLKEDVQTLVDLGAIYDKNKQWHVPEEIDDLEPFKRWWPPIPADLVDSTPRMLMTKDGRQVEGYVLGEDRYHGADSTATSLMYIALPVISALAWFLAGFSLNLGSAALLLALPYLYALGQGEGPAEAVKASILLLLLPYGLALGVDSSIGADRLLALVSSLGGGGKVIAGAVSLVVLTVLIFLWSLLFGNEQTGVGFNTITERVKDAVKWSAVIVAMAVVVSFLPPYLAPVYSFALACLYPMFYTEKNFKARGLLLKEQGEKYNLGTQGKLTDSHVPARISQAKNAAKDKSPMINLGTATGFLTTKHYPYAPDEGGEMSLSCADFSTHFLGFGETGSGKTSTMARNIILQYKRSRFGGALIRCGKGSLPGELRGIIDIMVEPGMKFAPFEGLDAKQIQIVLKSLVGDNDKNPIWPLGAGEFVLHITNLHEALYKHELAYIAFATDEARALENQINYAEADLAKLVSRGVSQSSTEKTRANIERMRHNLEIWISERDSERKWLWNVDTLDRLIGMVDATKNEGPGDELLKALNFLGYDPTGYVSNPPRRQETIHASIGKRNWLDQAITYVCKTWPIRPAEQRQSFLLNVRIQQIGPLMQGRDLVDEEGTPWYLLEKGVNVDRALYGEIVGINIPVDEHQQAAIVIQALIRQRIYNGIRKRKHYGDKWQEALPGQKPVMDLCDECQLVVSAAVEGEIAPIARSLGLMMVMLTQGYESLEEAFGSAISATKFANTFRTIVSLKASTQTYDYLIKRFGTAQMVRFPKPTVGLDYVGGVENAANSPLSDLNHPNRSLYRKLERMGAGRLDGLMDDDDNEFHGHQIRSRKSSGIRKTIKIPSGGIKEVMPVFLPEEYAALLVDQGKAIVWINRAGAPRVDVASLNYVPEGAMREVIPEEEVETV